jgi:hypothetical protein
MEKGIEILHGCPLRADLTGHGHPTLFCQKLADWPNWLSVRSALKRTPMQDFNSFSIIFYYITIDRARNSGLESRGQQTSPTPSVYQKWFITYGGIKVKASTELTKGQGPYGSHAPRPPRHHLKFHPHLRESLRLLLARELGHHLSITL